MNDRARRDASSSWLAERVPQSAAHAPGPDLDPTADPRRWAAWLCAQLAGAEDTGYFGPRSALWQVNREAVLGLGLGRAVLMQLAHPWVAQAVVDHSRVAGQPLDRLLATATAAELLVFGSRAQADGAAARIRRVHGRVSGQLAEDVGRWSRGTPYQADDPEALRWVLVTVVDTALRVYEATLGRIPDATVAQYLAEAAQLGAMLGLPADRMPRDRGDLAGYVQTVLADGTVAVGNVARGLAGALVRPRLPPGTDPFFRVYSWLTVAMAEPLLPKVLRDQYAGVLPRWHPGLYRLAGRAGRGFVRCLSISARTDPLAAYAIRRELDDGGPRDAIHSQREARVTSPGLGGCAEPGYASSGPTHSLS